MLSFASDKAKLFAENFSKDSNLDDSGIFLPVFFSRTNLKLHNISVTPKIIKKIITNLDMLKESGRYCIPVMVLKNCEPELFYVLAELFNKCLKEPCFPDCWKVLLVVPVFKNVGERSTAENYHPVSLLLVDVYLNWLNWFHFLSLKGCLLVILINCMTFLSLFLDVTRMSILTVYYLTQLDFRVLYL